MEQRLEREDDDEEETGKSLPHLKVGPLIK
jgi:hypothetical protein